MWFEQFEQLIFQSGTDEMSSSCSSSVIGEIVEPRQQTVIVSQQSQSDVK